MRGYRQHKRRAPKTEHPRPDVLKACPKLYLVMTIDYKMIVQLDFALG